MPVNIGNQFISIAVASALTFLSLIQQTGVVPLGMSGFEFARATGIESASEQPTPAREQKLPPLAHLDDASLLATAPPVNASRALASQLPPCVRYPHLSYCAVLVTAYSSTPDQTDLTPFITAAGTKVREGLAAANFLPFGTKIKLPALYGDRVFVVEDRLAKKNSHKVDLWFPSRAEALRFGIQWTALEVVK